MLSWGDDGVEGGPKGWAREMLLASYSFVDEQNNLVQSGTTAEE